ncbi:MAG: histidine kinase [Burkholderiales bacterium]|jgi:DNA-binding NarL/FixJ family response regulator
MTRAGPMVRVLLVEPHAVLRGTVAAVVRELDVVEVYAVASVAAARRTLAELRPDVLVLSLDEGEAAFTLLEALRRGGDSRGAETAVAVTATACDAPTASRLRALDVRRLLLKPFKVRTVLETVSGLCATALRARADDEAAEPA